MSHEVETMAYFGTRPWHGLGTALDEADLYDWQSASKKAGLDWTVELVPLVTVDTQAGVDHRAVRRTSDKRVLGVVGPRYHPLQNKDAFAWFQPFLDASFLPWTPTLTDDGHASCGGTALAPLSRSAGLTSPARSDAKKEAARHPLANRR